MPDVPDVGKAAGVLKKKVAGLPVGVWLVIIGAGVGLGIYLRSRDKNTEESDTTDESYPLATEADYGYQTDAAATDYGPAYGGGGGSYGYPTLPTDPYTIPFPAEGPPAPIESGGAIDTATGPNNQTRIKIQRITQRIQQLKQQLEHAPPAKKKQIKQRIATLRNRRQGLR